MLETNCRRSGVTRVDGGAVLLIDSGDTFQGGIESNLSEGALVVDAYNAMGYARRPRQPRFRFRVVDSPTDDSCRAPAGLQGAPPPGRDIPLAAN